MRQSLFVDLAPPFQRAIGVGICLEICQIVLHARVPPTVELYSLFQLLQNAFPGSAVIRMESGIVAVGASSGSDRAISVRAGESGINDQLLQALAE